MLLLASSGASSSMHVGMHLGQRRFQRMFLQAVLEFQLWPSWSIFLLWFLFFLSPRQLLACMHACSGEAVRQLAWGPLSLPISLVGRRVIAGAVCRKLHAGSRSPHSHRKRAGFTGAHTVKGRGACRYFCLPVCHCYSWEICPLGLSA